MFKLRITQDQAGIAATEFALIAPTLILLICGVIEFAWVASARAALESATMKAARLVAASDCPAQRETLLSQTIVKQMGYVRSSDGQLPQIEKLSYNTKFGDVGEPEPLTKDVNKNGKYEPADGDEYQEVNGRAGRQLDMGVSGSLGAAGQVVSYTATYNVKSMMPWIAKKFRNGLDYYPIRATTVIRNEPVFRTTGCPK